MALRSYLLNFRQLRSYTYVYADEFSASKIWSQGQYSLLAVSVHLTNHQEKSTKVESDPGHPVCNVRVLATIRSFTTFLAIVSLHPNNLDS